MVARHRLAKNHGPLDHNERLIPKTFFVFGGKYTGNNLMVKDAAEAMRIRGPIAQQIHNLPDGATIELTITD